MKTDNKKQYPTHGLPLLPCGILKVRLSPELLSYMTVLSCVKTTATAAALGTLALM